MKKQYFAPEVEQVPISTGCVMTGSPTSDPFGDLPSDPGSSAPARRTLIVP